MGAGGPRTEAPPPPAGPPASTSGPAGRSPLVWLPRILAAVVVLYALQTLYSPDFSKGLQNVCFFFVPFSLVYALLRDVEWDRRLLTLVLWVVGVEAVAFVLVGSVEYLSRSLFWNDQVIRSNEFHTYFRVNSVFWDPNVYGRYLSLVIVVAMTALLWARERRSQALLAGLVARPLDRPGADLLAVELRRPARRPRGARGAALEPALDAGRGRRRRSSPASSSITLAGGSEKVSFDRINIDTSGRANLVSGGIHLFAQRPVYGYGSGCFPEGLPRAREDPQGPGLRLPHRADHRRRRAGPRRARSPTRLCSSSRSGRWRPACSPRDRGEEPAGPRAPCSATFVALLVHTMAYAGFFEDPITWVLMAAAVSLAAAPVRDPA